MVGTPRKRADDGFAFCPDNGPSRLIRYDLPWSDFGLVAALDFDQNLLRVCRELYDELSEMQQHIVLKTRDEFTYLKDLQQY